MTDDDLTRRLEAWASATDPSAHPITADEVTSAEAVVLPHRRRRLGLVAAVVLAVLALGVGAALVLQDDPRGRVVTDDGGVSGGPRTQIVVDGERLDPYWWRSIHRIELRGPCPDDACETAPTAVAQPLEAGTSLAVDQPLAPGRWMLTAESYRCDRDDDDCGPPNPDGTPSEDVAPTTCELPVDVGPEPSRLVVRVGPRDGGLGCSGPPSSFDLDAELTVPPAWTVRPELPWSCGAASYRINGMVAGPDPEGARETLDCFRDAIATGTPVEIPAWELGAADSAIRGRWRVLPEPVDGHRVEILRNDGGWWSRQLCDDIEVETTELDDGEGGTTTHVGARPVGCGDEEQLSLELPPLTDPEPSPTSTTPATATTASPAPPAPGTIDVVLDADDLPMFIEGAARRWAISVDGREVAAGNLTEAGTSSGGYVGRPDVVQVGDDVPAPDGTAVAVRVDSSDCSVRGACRGDGTGPAPGTAPDGSCPADAPGERAGAVLVVTLRGESCTAAWSEVPPPLTVPPAWSLRPAGDGCGAVALDDRWGQCLADALRAGGDAEYTRAYDGLRVTYVAAEGALRVYRHTGGTGSEVTWTVQGCTGAEVDPSLELVPTGCGPEVDMDLTPR